MAADHFEYCLDQVRLGDRDRHLALLFAPTAARGHLAALAAFNLELARARDQLGHVVVRGGQLLVEPDLAGRGPQAGHF